MNTGMKIRQLRKRKGLSQEQLAEEAKISLRTIQRVETGESMPNGDSLIKISAALIVPIEDIFDFAAFEDTGFLTILNLSALTFFFHPLLGVVCPLILWILKKDKIRGVNSAGKNIIVFQLTWALILYITTFILSGGLFITLDINILHVIGAATTVENLVPFMIIMGLVLLNVILISINTFRVRRGKDTKYLPVSF